MRGGWGRRGRTTRVGPVADAVRQDKYPLFEGHVEVPSIWVGVQVEDGERHTQEGVFEIRVLAPYPEGGWIYERLVFEGKRGPDLEPQLREFGLMPDENLRRLFEPMTGEMVGKSVMKQVFGG